MRTGVCFGSSLIISDRSVIKMKKLFLLLAFMVCGLASNVFAEQITKFAVVDTDRVYKAFFNNSQSMRNYEAKKASFQAEITRLTNELQDLKTRKSEYAVAGKNAEAEKLQEEINTKAQNLRDYTASKNAELKRIKGSMESGDAFYKRLYRIIGSVAEQEGYCMVLSPQQNNSILWYSDSVDITDKVIAQLKK
jgi:outer membrane protein